MSKSWGLIGGAVGVAFVGTIASAFIAPQKEDSEETKNRKKWISIGVFVASLIAALIMVVVALTSDEGMCSVNPYYNDTVFCDHYGRLPPHRHMPGGIRPTERTERVITKPATMSGHGFRREGDKLYKLNYPAISSNEGRCPKGAEFGEDGRCVKTNQMGDKMYSAPAPCAADSEFNISYPEKITCRRPCRSDYKWNKATQLCERRCPDGTTDKGDYCELSLNRADVEVADSVDPRPT